MFSISYLLNKIESAGLKVDAVTAVRELVGRPLLGKTFDDVTRSLAEKLAAGIADGSLKSDEIAAQASLIDARRGGEGRAITLATKRARAIIDKAARSMLADAGPQMVKELDRRARELRAQVVTATNTLTDAGILLGDMDARQEALQLGPVTASAWATRESALDALNELAGTRKELSDLGLIPPQTAAAERAERRAAAKSAKAESSFGDKVRQLMPGAV
jgi:hypothetical protein